MKLSAALDLGFYLGCTKMHECLDVAYFKAPSLFVYENIPEELKELYSEYALYKSGELKIDVYAIKIAARKRSEDLGIGVIYG